MRNMESMTKRSLVFFVLLSLQMGLTIAQSPIRKYPEYVVKSQFLRQIIKDIQWPEGSELNDPSKPFVIGVIGDNPFESYLDDVFSDRKINGKDTNILYFSDLKKIDKCYILFITNSRKDDLSRILEITRAKPILTVGDTPGFAEQGVLINLCINKEPKTTVCLEINEKAFRESKLKPAARLVSIAKNVDPLEPK
jgi:hypothetical protein